MQKQTRGMITGWRDRYWELRGKFLCCFLAEHAYKSDKSKYCRAAMHLAKLVRCSIVVCEWR